MRKLQAELAFAAETNEVLRNMIKRVWNPRQLFDNTECKSLIENKLQEQHMHLLERYLHLQSKSDHQRSAIALGNVIELISDLKRFNENFN